MTQLIHYDAARKALAEAVRFDDVLAIKDMAKHAELYARQARDTELIERATEIKVRAERRAGQMLSEAKASGDLRGKGNPQLSNATTIGLTAIGITRDESSRWQKLAAVPDNQFEQAVAAAKEVAGEVTTAAMLRIEKANRPPKAAPVAKMTNGNDAKNEELSTDDDAAFDEQKNIWIESLKAQEDQITDLIARQAVSIMDIPENERIDIIETIAGLRAQVKSLEINLDAVTVARDGYMRENASLMQQCKTQRAQIKKLGGK